MLSESTGQRFLRILLCFLLSALAVWLFLRYLIGPVFPFLLAYLFAAVLQPVIRFCETRLRLPRRVTALLSVAALTALVGGGFFLLARRISEEGASLVTAAEEFLARLHEEPEFAGKVIDRIDGWVPFVDLKEPLGAFVAGLDGKLTALLGRLAEPFTGSLLPALLSAAAFLPNALLFLIVFLLAAYYLAADYRGVHAAARSFLPPAAVKKVVAFRGTLGEALGSFVRAYGLLMLITFSELFSALLVMGVRYAFLIALGTAVIDILPVLGTGTVLIPWGIAELLLGNTGRGAALLVVYAVMTVIRQILEPRIVGKYIGLPPIAALFSMYLGLRLFGVAGLILFPILAIPLWKNGREAL